MATTEFVPVSGCSVGAWSYHHDHECTAHDVEIGAGADEADCFTHQTA